MIKIFTDGGARGNPGPAAAAFVVKDGEKIIFQHGVFLGITTNNVAEYRAIIEAWNWLLQNKLTINDSRLTISFFLDSLLVVNQLQGKYKIKNEKLRELAVVVKKLEKELPESVNYAHIPREKNYLADKIVNQTLDNL